MSLNRLEQLLPINRRPLISTVVLNRNRAHLLRLTVESYLATVQVPYELIIVDSASSDESRQFIETICRKSRRHTAVLLEENIGGGEAINLGLRSAHGRFLHISENDVQYLAGWDRELLSKFDTFQELGQLSPMSPDPPEDEVAWRRPASPLTKGNKTIWLVEPHIGQLHTTCLCRREVWDRGGRWRSFESKRPDDYSASKMIQQMGYWVAWNDKYTVVNLGHMIEEWQRYPTYYVEDYQGKPAVGVDGLRRRLRAKGYDLIEENGRHKIVKL